MAIGPDTPALLSQVADVLDLADAFCRGERLLALAATEQQREFQTWFVGEVLRKSNGASPLHWLGKQGPEQRARRSEERREGKGGVSTGRSWGSPGHKQKQKQ